MPSETQSPNRLTTFLIRLGFGVLCFVLAMGWVGLALAGEGVFNPFVTWLAGAFAGFAGWILSRSIAGESHNIPGNIFLVGVCIILGSLVMNQRPGELILGGWDPGVYLHTAASVAHKGALKISDPDLAVLTPEEREVIARNLFGVAEPFGGMRVLPTGETSPSFHHAYPCLMASVWPLGGIRAALMLNPIFNAGSLILIFCLGTMLWNYRYGLLAAFLLALNPAQVWQAGFSTAEMTTQFFLLASSLLLLLSQSRRAGGNILAIIAAWCFGFALLIRYDTIVFMVPVVLVLLAGISSAAYPRRIAIFAIALIPPLFHYWYFQRYIAPYYHPVSGMVINVLWICAVLLALWLFKRRVLRAWFIKHDAALDRALRLCLGVGFITWLVLAWFIRPLLLEDNTVQRTVSRALEVAGLSNMMPFLAGPDATNVYHLISFMGWPGFILAMTGLAVAVFRVRSIALRALLYASIGSLIIITTHVFNDHFLMWVARRFVPVIVPLLVLGVVAVVAWVVESRVAKSHRGWVTVLCGLVIVAFHFQSTKIVAVHRDWPGLIEWFDQVDASIPDDAVVFCDQPGFAAPLRYLYGRKSYEMHLREPELRIRLMSVMRHRLDTGQTVYLLSMAGPMEQEFVTMVPEEIRPLVSGILNHQPRGIPGRMKDRGGDFILYRVEPR
jgi:hypothetical protein